MERSTVAILILSLALILAILYFVAITAPYVAVFGRLSGGIGYAVLLVFLIIVVLAVALAVTVRVRLSY